MLSIFFVSMYRFFIWISKKIFQLVTGFQNSWIRCKPNKNWIDKGSEYYNRSVKSWLQDNEVEVYSTHNKGKFVVVEDLLKP